MILMLLLHGRTPVDAPLLYAEQTWMPPSFHPDYRTMRVVAKLPNPEPGLQVDHISLIVSPDDPYAPLLDRRRRRLSTPLTVSAKQNGDRYDFLTITYDLNFESVS